MDAQQDQVPFEYELGRSNGVADGSVDYDWAQGRIESTWEQLREDVRDAAAHSPREYRAYILGYARGYREATQGAPDGKGYSEPVAVIGGVAIYGALTEAQS